MNAPTKTSLRTNTTNKPHAHARWTVKENGVAHEEHVKTYTEFNTTTLAGILDGFVRQYVFVEYNESYARDQEGNTEYVRFEGTIKGGFTLQVDLFSCYCEPLNENQEPPF